MALDTRRPHLWHCMSKNMGREISSTKPSLLKNKLIYLFFPLWISSNQLFKFICTIHNNEQVRVNYLKTLLSVNLLSFGNTYVSYQNQKGSSLTDTTFEAEEVCETAWSKYDKNVSCVEIFFKYHQIKMFGWKRGKFI